MKIKKSVVVSIISVIIAACCFAGLDAQQQRFIDNGNGTITDLKTGLIWTKNANLAGKRMKWEDAVSFVKTVKISGKSDWRLPSKDELVSIREYIPSQEIDASTGHTWLTNQGFNIVQEFYWSSTESVSSAAQAWIVVMSYGSVGCEQKELQFYVWPVRGKKN